MTISGKQIKLCNCNRTMPLDGKALGTALGLEEPVVIHQELCRAELGHFEACLKRGDEVIVACTQEAALFSEVAQTQHAGAKITFVNIRETGGWSAESSNATAKQAALLAVAALPDPGPVASVSYRSDGDLLIVGPADKVFAWAEPLSTQLRVSVLLTDSRRGGELPALHNYPVHSGRVTQIKGWLGAIDVSWEQSNPIDLDVCTRCNACIHACPEQAIDFTYQIDLDKCKAHRKCVTACADIGAIDFYRKDIARSDRFDLVLDLGDQPFLKMHQPPQGYFAPGDDPLTLAKTAIDITQAVGEFEKPKYFQYNHRICAHGRNKKTGCSLCIDICSAEAIASDGNYVKVEPHLCMGCGACATVCPSGAMTYAYPAVTDLGMRVKIALATYREAGGRAACLLFHNTTDGRDLIAKLARRGRGLPARLIPLEAHHIAALGIDLMLGAIVFGATQFMVLSAGSEAPQYFSALKFQMQVAQTIMHGLGYPGVHFDLLEAATPDGLEKMVWGLKSPAQIPAAGFNLTSEKRRTLELIIEHLAKHAHEKPDAIALPAGAPWGTVNVNTETCTLCMSCVGACPASALLDTPDFPRLKFIERNCVQCGLCEVTCPENAISLTPRLLLTPDFKRERVLNEGQPFHCVRCGKPFGTAQMIENMLGRLNTHSMFPDANALRRIQMCADCRVVDMMENRGEVSIFDATRK